MTNFFSRKKTFVKQAFIEVFITFSIALFIAKYTQNFALVLSLFLSLALIRAYFYAYKIFLNLQTDELTAKTGLFVYKNIFDHLNFSIRQNAFKKRSYLKLLVLFRKYLQLIQLPIMLLDKEANLHWKNKAALELFYQKKESFEKKDFLKNKLIGKLRNKIKKGKEKSRLKTKSKNTYIELQLFKLNKEAFLVVAYDFTFYKKIQKFQLQNMHILQDDLNLAISKNIKTINSMLSASRISDECLKNMKEDYSRIKAVVERFDKSIKS